MIPGEKKEYVLFYGIPKSSFKLIRSQSLNSTNLHYYENLLQISGRNVAIIINLDLPGE